MYRDAKQCLLLLAVLWLTLPVLATPALSVPSASRFSRLDIQQGLSQNTVTALAQDSSGNVWIGTQNGLNRFDGFSVKVFRPDKQQANTLSDNFITSLAIDASGIIWVGTLNGLNRFDPTQGKFSAITTMPLRAAGYDVVLSLHMDKHNRLWVGTDRGVALWHEESQQLTIWQEPLQDNTHQNITALASDDDTLWVGTPQGLKRYDMASKAEITLESFPQQHASVMALYHDPTGQLWLGLEHEGLLLRSADGNTWQHIALDTYDNGVVSKEIRSITMDQAGEVWVGTQHGLNQLAEIDGRWQQTESYYHQRHNPSSLGSGKVMSIFSDKDGSIWVGTWNGGVSRLNEANNLFASFTPDLSLIAKARNAATISLLADAETLWVGTADGLFELNLNANTFNQVAEQNGSFTYYSALDSQQQIWFGHAQGITAFDKASQGYQELILPPEVTRGPVRRMWQDEHFVWLAIDQFGLMVLNPALTQVLQFKPFNRAVTFIKPIDHYVLVGSYNGLSWFDRQSAELVYHHELSATPHNDTPTLPSAPMDYVQSSDGRHWLATNGGGLYQMHYPPAHRSLAEVRFDRSPVSDKLKTGQLKTMVQDNADNIWLSTAFGISLFTPANDTVRNFGQRHGTLSRDYINASGTALENGNIAFGAMEGFTLFKPEHVAAYQAKPIAAPQIQAIRINNTPLANDPGDADIALAHILYKAEHLSIPAKGARSVSVDFSTREYIETGQVKFQYRLDPIDTDWTTQDATRRNASFERLPPGKYTLRLRAGLEQTGWSNETKLNISVMPYWWETWLARILLVIILASALLGLHYFRLQQLHKRQEELAHLVVERTKALEESKNKAEQTLQHLASTMQELVRTEKMAALGQLVAGVAHEVNTPLGVALTANSVVSEESRQLQQKLAEGNIRRQEMDAFLYKLSQATRLLDSNLQRAAQLVANFKQVSVDRTADNQRKFNLALYLDELLESLSLMWKTRHISISVNCPDNIVMDSYPGTIGQIITNFTQNAVVHGFKEAPSGEISISCKQLDDKVEIIFADNGSGISKDNLQRIFDPFFTTNRHEGGTGLGLHIVYNLITQKLRGSISVASPPGEGTRFTLLLPLKI
jgi:ligand-binding sensor domain-containing protein/signal transduction histidine kinase